jgi:hypothetical protein
MFVVQKYFICKLYTKNSNLFVYIFIEFDPAIAYRRSVRIAEPLSGLMSYLIVTYN